MISRKVCAFGHLRLISIARMPKRSTWMVAPEAYQKGPETPSCQALLDDWRRVAAHVHCETITEPVRPILTLRPAVLKCSEPLVFAPTTFCSSQVSPTVKIVKKAPKPSTMP